MHALFRPLGLTALAVCLTLSTASQAQDFPRRAITIIVGNAPGITTDVLSRLVASKLNERLGWTVIIDNKPGANHAVAARLVMQAPADGHTMLAAVSSMALAPHTTKNLPYDFAKDFEPISRMAAARTVLLAGPNQPFTDLPGMIRYARANPGKLSFASANSGSITHLGGELLKQVAGLNIVNIPYNNSAFNTDIAGGTVPLGVNTVSSSAALAKTGKIRALAVLSGERDPALPDVPSTGELGMPEVVADAWYGLAVRAGTPRDIVARLSREIMLALEQPDVKAKIIGMGASPISETPEAFRTRFNQDYTRWAGVIQKANLKFE